MVPRVYQQRDLTSVCENSIPPQVETASSVQIGDRECCPEERRYETRLDGAVLRNAAEPVSGGRMSPLSPELSQALAALGKIAVAYLLTLPVGWQREREAHSVGVRTFPIVAMASCGYLLIAFPGDTAAQSRVLQGLITGIGFVGGGAILKEGATVRGTATAASIWCTGVVGAAVAMGHYEVAVILSVLNLVTLRLLWRVKQQIDLTDAPPRHRDAPEERRGPPAA